ncbi:hypothetical protein ACLKA6_014493 [Drosophila palustris]
MSLPAAVTAKTSLYELNTEACKELGLEFCKVVDFAMLKSLRNFIQNPYGFLKHRETFPNDSFDIPL